MTTRPGGPDDTYYCEPSQFSEPLDRPAGQSTGTGFAPGRETAPSPIGGRRGTRAREDAGRTAPSDPVEGAVRETQAPAGGAPSGSSAPPAGLTGEAFRQAWRDARSGRAAAGRGDRGRRASRAAGTDYKPGQNRTGGTR